MGRSGRHTQLNDKGVLDAAKDAALRLDVLDLLQPDDLGLGEHLERKVRHAL